MLTVVCPNAKSVWINAPRRFSQIVTAEMGKTLSVVKFDLKEHLERCKIIEEKFNERTCIRITVKDEQGNCAYTRAYFLEELI